MTLQADLFSSPDDSAEHGLRAGASADVTTRVLAVPCGFLNGANRPCRRLGNLPIMIEGAPLTRYGAKMVHCDPACFRSEAIPVPTWDEDDFNWRDVSPSSDSEAEDGSAE